MGYILRFILSIIWSARLYFVPKYHSESSSMALLMIPDHFSKFRSFEKLCHKNPVRLRLEIFSIFFPHFSLHHSVFGHDSTTCLWFTLDAHPHSGDWLKFLNSVSVRNLMLLFVNLLMNLFWYVVKFSSLMSCTSISSNLNDLKSTFLLILTLMLNNPFSIL